MASDYVFISHTSSDDGTVERIREALEAQRVPVWDDARRQTGGDKLDPQIKAAIEGAGHVLAVISPETFNSKWVTREIEHALEVEKQRRDGFKVIPVLLSGVKHEALHHWFGEEPLALRIDDAPGGIEAAMPKILAALGKRLPTDQPTEEQVDAPPVHDLVLELTFPKMKESEGTRRATATANLACYPATPGQREVESRPFVFTAPIGPIEADDLSWYVERYFLWPAGVFSDRAREIEKKLPEWGQLLFDLALSNDKTGKALSAWETVPEGAIPRLSVLVDSEIVTEAEAPKGDETQLSPEQAEANEAATLLLALPWELVHDGRGYLFQKGNGVRVRRRMPNRYEQEAMVTDPPVRVLLVSPRPEDERTPYIDHRVSAKPLTEAFASLGKLAELTILTPPTFMAMQEELQRARDENTPYHVVHFDGHGVYDRKLGLGALCFEDPADSHKLQERRSETVGADKIAAVIRDHRIPLFFLEACETAKAEEDPTASVAARLLQEGVASVVAMSHSVLVETARRFVGEFYSRLVQGARVGQAMLAGQRGLYGDTYRGKVFGAGELRLQDWFVPVLYQEETDLQLLTAVPTDEVEAVRKKGRKLALGDLPDEPAHTFVGRSRELLTAERLLADVPYVALRGQGGEGKTTLGAELARWLVKTNRFDRAAFVSLEDCGDTRTVMDALGGQLLPKYSVAEHGNDLEKAFQPIERALGDRRTVIVLDNMESVLPPPEEESGVVYEPEVLERLFGLFKELVEIDGTRLVFTSREPLPEPFHQYHVAIGRLDEEDAVRLVAQVLVEGRLTPGHDDYGANEEAIRELVEAVNCHARSLVLVAREVGEAGVSRATENLHELMARLQQKYPDDRERSLFASVELSLRRLPEETRKLIRPLGVFRGGANATTMAQVLGLEPDEVRNVARQLIDVGLAEEMPYSHLRFHAALCPYLLAELDKEERERAEQAWAESMAQLGVFLYQQSFADARLAATLTPLELPNLLAALETMAAGAPAEAVVSLATRLEQIVAVLGRPKALARIVSVRERAREALGEWGHARFEVESAAIERLLDQGDLAKARDAAEGLLRRCKDEGQEAYEGAPYDLAMAHNLVGQALVASGAAESAIAAFAQAKRRFHVLANEGDRNAALMVAATINRTANCLQVLGRLEDAAVRYQESIELFEKLGDARWVAVSREHLATVRLRQQRFNDALAGHRSARQTFERLNEPRSVAVIWHQIGIVHQKSGDCEGAEAAYRKSLAVSVRERNRSDEASTLGQLGTLYDEAMDRPEDAVTFYRQGIEIYAELKDLAKEGVARNNLADTLIKLRRYDEARRELRRAIECDRPFGHAAEPWKTWQNLCNLERAVGDGEAAAKARERAVQAYLEYRRAGGESTTPGGELCAMTAQAIAEGKSDQVAAELAQLLSTPDIPGFYKTLIQALQAILAGSRDPALARDPELDYDDAVELMLLLEKLTEEPPRPQPSDRSRFLTADN